ncbi:MAG: hypothetical protein ACE5HE_10705 [Phycisphaerae bacterium]
MNQIEDSVIDRLLDARGSSVIVRAMRTFYEDVDRLVARESPTCRNRGVCCRFGRFGHRLYVTALEVIYYLSLGEVASPEEDDVCPHAKGGRCEVRDRRLLGCRVFYCDANTQGWQGPLMERLLTQLRALHAKLGVPYFYADWMLVLRAFQSRDTDASGRRGGDSYLPPIMSQHPNDPRLELHYDHIRQR